MYTSGWPNPQKKCCHKMADPNELGLKKCAELPVGQQHHQRRVQHRQRKDDHEAVHQHHPDKQRQPADGQPRGAQREDGNDQIDRGGERSDADGQKTHQPVIHARVIGIGLLAERRVAEPSGRRRMSGGNAHIKKQPAEHRQPKAQRVQPGQRHVAPPIINGTMYTAKPNPSGMTTRNIIVVPCSVKSWS